MSKNPLEPFWAKAHTDADAERVAAEIARELLVSGEPVLPRLSKHFAALHRRLATAHTKRADELDIDDAHRITNPATSPVDVQRALNHLGGIQSATEVKEGFSVKPNHNFLVIALGGYYGAGKDEYADEIVDKLGFEKTFMSKYLQKCIQTVNPWIMTDVPVTEQTDRVSWPANSLVKYSQLDEAVGYAGAKKQREVREWLQLMGTEVGRKILGEDTWVKLVREDLCEIQKRGNNAVITGIRYSNELDLIHEFRGKTVWITRPGFEPTGTTAGHSSERTLTPLDFYFEVLNEGSLDDLKRKALTQAGGWIL